MRGFKKAAALKKYTKQECFLKFSFVKVTNELGNKTPRLQKYSRMIFHEMGKINTVVQSPRKQACECLRITQERRPCRKHL